MPLLLLLCTLSLVVASSSGSSRKNEGKPRPKPPPLSSQPATPIPPYLHFHLALRRVNPLHPSHHRLERHFPIHLTPLHNIPLPGKLTLPITDHITHLPRHLDLHVVISHSPPRLHVLSSRSLQTTPSTPSTSSFLHQSQTSSTTSKRSHTPSRTRTSSSRELQACCKQLITNVHDYNRLEKAAFERSSAEERVIVDRGT